MADEIITASWKWSLGLERMQCYLTHRKTEINLIRAATGVVSCRCGLEKTGQGELFPVTAATLGQWPWLPHAIGPSCLNLRNQQHECLWLCHVQSLFSSRRPRNTNQSYSDCCLQAFNFMPYLCCTCFPTCTSPWHSTGAHQADLQDPRRWDQHPEPNTSAKWEVLEMHSEFSWASPS